MKTHDPLVLKKPGIWVRKSTLNCPTCNGSGVILQPCPKPPLPAIAGNRVSCAVAHYGQCTACNGTGTP